jgi:chemotaxis family two-component system response regulator Rcp1
MITVGEPIEILLVEDNPGDVRLTREALADSKVYSRFHVASDGLEAMAFLRRQPPHQDAVRPDLILLDLNVPKVSGLEVLKNIKTDLRLRMVPVVVLTSSQAERDIAASYHLRANAFVTKPVNLDQFLKVVRAIDSFWLAVVKLPPK